jgi:ABC-type transport system substrate-binding protein
MPGVEPLRMYEGPDLARARALLAEAGYPNGFTTRLYGYTAEPTPREVAVVQQQLAQIGITCELDLGEAVGYTSMAGDTSRRIPFGYYAWTADYVDPSNFIDVLLNGLRITPKNNLNLSLFNDPDVNAMIHAATREPDGAKRIAMWNRIDRMIMERAPIAPLHHQLESRLYGPALGGWYRHITRILKLEQLYVKQPADAAPVAARAAQGGV